MPEKLQECPVCQGKDFNNYKTCRDFTVSRETFNIVNCENCHFKFTNPRPAEHELMQYYQSPQYISHSNKTNSFINFIYKNVRKITVKQKAKLVTSLTETGHLLDYGCGTGEFLKACQDKGWRVLGVEPASLARQQAINLTQADIYGSIFDIEKQQQYNVITLWHVLEHVPQIDETLMKIKRLLKPSGRLVIAVPNYKSYDAGLYKEFWAGYDVPRHLYHFDKKSISALLAKHHLKVETVLPQKLDAYYVSLLSEKNQSANTNMLKAFITGYRSNHEAKKNNLNYSSLIYIVRHD